MRTQGRASDPSRTAASERPRALQIGDFTPIALVLAGGLCVAALIFAALSRHATESVARQVRLAAEERRELLCNSAGRSLEVLHALAAFVTVSRPSRAEFRHFVQHSLRRLPEVQALEWIPRVALEERSRFEEAARQDGIVGFQFTELSGDGRLGPARQRSEYFPVYYAEPTYPNRPALGLDLASDVTRGAALAQAAAAEASVASAPVRLAQEQHSGQLGYLVFSPVRQGHRLSGFALAVFRVESLVRPAFASLPADDFEVVLSDVTGAERRLARFGGPLASARPDLAHEARLDLAGRQLSLVVTPSGAFAAAHSPAGLWGYPLCFVGLTLALSLHLCRNVFRAREVSHMNARLSAEITIRGEAQRQAARAHKAQSRFLASMSHEIRTPLNAIVGYAQLLHRDHSDATTLEATAVMLQSSHHLLALVDDILDLSKIEAGHVTLSAADFDLESTLSSLSFLFRHKCEQRGLALSVQGLTGEPCWVRGDEAKLRQILINLLGNAVKFTEHGAVGLRVRAEGMHGFAFEVTDTGPGIDDEDQLTIFENFRQGKNARAGTGTGLGLAIAKQLIELMGGQLALESRLGAGSTFRFGVQFHTPQSVSPAQAHLAVPRVRLAPGSTCRCLVVDDLEVNRKLLCQILDSLGCTSLGAGSGEEGLERAQSFLPDVVFMDVLMPQLDGFQATRALLARRDAALPRVVAFSASALDSERAAYLDAGFDGFLPKPFRIQQVSECLSRLLELRFVADEPRAEEPTPACGVVAAGVPPELLRRLRDAARLYQATRLKALLAELERLGPAHAGLARRLKALADVYDMPALARILEREELSCSA